MTMKTLFGKNMLDNFVARSVAYQYISSTSADAILAAQKEIKKAAQNQYFASLFLKGSDKTRYREFLHK